MCFTQLAQQLKTMWTRKYFLCTKKYLFILTTQESNVPDSIIFQDVSISQLLQRRGNVFRQ
jgi:hypothetical protein